MLPAIRFINERVILNLARVLCYLLVNGLLIDNVEMLFNDIEPLNILSQPHETLFITLPHDNRATY